MDGNRRWARRHAFKTVFEGHSRGADRLVEVCHWCEEVGIKYLTVYAFSTENWKRSAEEINGIFKLMHRLFEEQIDECLEIGLRVKILGNRSMLSEDGRETVEKVEELTKDCKKMTLFIALSYGGRDEIVRAARAAAEDVRAGRLLCRDLDEEKFGLYLDTGDAPDVDLVIRTGGQKRLSNFLPWQTVYSEFYFTEVLWPDFTRRMFDKALQYYDQVQINRGK